MTFPATSTNWNKVSLAKLQFADGTYHFFDDYSVVAGKTFEGVVAANVRNSDYYCCKMYFDGKILAFMEEATLNGSTNSPTSTVFSNSGHMVYVFMADTNISAIEMYNTD